MSIVVQALEVVSVSTAAFSYQVALGPVARLRVHAGGWLTQFGAYGDAAVALGPLQPQSPEVGLDVVAAVAVALLLRDRGDPRVPAALPAPAA